MGASLSFPTPNWPHAAISSPPLEIRTVHTLPAFINTDLQKTLPTRGMFFEHQRSAEFPAAKVLNNDMLSFRSHSWCVLVLQNGENTRWYRPLLRTVSRSSALVMRSSFSFSHRGGIRRCARQNLLLQATLFKNGTFQESGHRPWRFAEQSGSVAAMMRSRLYADVLPSREPEGPLCT